MYSEYIYIVNIGGFEKPYNIIVFFFYHIGFRSADSISYLLHAFLKIKDKNITTEKILQLK